MTFSLKKLMGLNPAKAEVVDGHLILSLPHAKEPVVWRMALDQIGTAAFEVKHDDATGATKLILKPKKGTAEIIAPFENKDEAVDALMVASNAMQTARPQHTTIMTTSHDSENGKSSEKIQTRYQDSSNENKDSQKWVIALFGAIVVVGLYFYLTTLMPETVVGFENQNTGAPIATAPQQSTGVPVSADDFLGGL